MMAGRYAKIDARLVMMVARHRLKQAAENLKARRHNPVLAEIAREKMVDTGRNRP